MFTQATRGSASSSARRIWPKETTSTIAGFLARREARKAGSFTLGTLSGLRPSSCAAAPTGVGVGLRFRPRRAVELGADADEPQLGGGGDGFQDRTAIGPDPRK